MSFILDALKKSESDRQRQSGPALYEVRVAPPRNGLPLWAVGLAVLLAVNLVIVAWVLLRRAPEAAAPGNAASQGAGGGFASMPSQAVGGQQVFGSPQGGPPGGAYAGQAGTQPTGGAYGGQQPAGAYPPPGPDNPLNQQASMPPNGVPGGGTQSGAPLGQAAGMTQPAQSGMAPSAPAAGGSPQGSQGVQGERLNPDDYAPAADPGPMPTLGSHVARGTSSGVPLYQDAALAPGAHIPELRLDLHVFAAKPQERFVMINMHKLREGDSLPEGVRVDSITPEGAVLSKDGTRFLLPRD